MHQQVTFRGLDPVSSVVDEVSKQAAKLNARLPALDNCEVVVEAGGRHRAMGYGHCRVVVRLWGAEPSGLLCSSVSDAHVRNLRPSVHRAFEAVRRQIA